MADYCENMVVILLFSISLLFLFCLLVLARLLYSLMTLQFHQRSNIFLVNLYIFRMAEYFYLRFYHKRQFVKNKYLCRKCINIPIAVEVDKFSFLVLMEYVKDDLGYCEIGGIYVKKQGQGVARNWLVLMQMWGSLLRVYQKVVT